MDDVLIIGGGLAGLSTAWHLAPTRRVRVIEQGRQLAAEASAQNAGMQRRLAHDPIERQLAFRAGECLAEPPEGFEHCARRTGGVVLSESFQPTLEDAAMDLRSRGLSVEPVPPLPALEGTRFAQGFWLPDEALIDAHALAQAFWRGAHAHGAQLQLDTRVLGLDVDNARVRGVHTTEGPIEADFVVLATGAWSGHLARGIGLERPLIAMQRHLVQTRSHPLAQTDHPWMWFDDAGIYARPEGGGWLVSPCDETAVEPRREPGSSGSVDPIGQALADAKLEAHFPRLSGSGWRGGWTGLRTFAPDRRPLLGADPEVKGLFWATGLGGFGVTCAFSVGEVVSEAIENRTPMWLDSAAVRPDRRYNGPIVEHPSHLERYV